MVSVRSRLAGLHSWAPSFAEFAKTPKTLNSGKMINFAVVSPIHLVRANGQTVTKLGPGGAPRSDTVKTNGYLGIF